MTRCGSFALPQANRRCNTNIVLIGCIADDFTGAGDIANTLSSGGMHTGLFVGTPQDVVTDFEAGVIALKTRSAPVAEAVAESLRALAWLTARGCRQFVFKYCSTFDSTTQGNIGPVAEALACALGTGGVVVCPAFPANGRTVYQGHLFVKDRLLSESGMEHHPLTPMTDPDIRRWLTGQCTGGVGHVNFATVRAGPDALRAALAAAAVAGERLVVVDAVADDDLRAIGAAVASAALLTGGSGIALALPANFRKAGLITGVFRAAMPLAGPALILSGSCSNATCAQVRRYADQHPAFMVETAAMMAGEPVVDAAWAFIEVHADSAPLIFSTADPAQVVAAQDKFGREPVAMATEVLFGELARRGVAAGVRRLVVAGGETSGAVVKSLGLRTLTIGPEIAPGVPSLRSVAGAVPLSLALKSGNFGDVDFFARAVKMLGGEID